jgi:hypothetical protein
MPPTAIIVAESRRNIVVASGVNGLLDQAHDLILNAPGRVLEQVLAFVGERAPNPQSIRHIRKAAVGFGAKRSVTKSDANVRRVCCCTNASTIPTKCGR